MRNPSLLALALLAAAIMIADGYDMQIMAILVPLLADIWQLPAAEFGVTQSAAVLGIGVGSALLGPLGDKYGRRKTILPGFALTTLCVLASAFADNTTSMNIFRFGTGLGLGLCIVNINALLAKHCPEQHRSLILTVVACGIPLGAILSGWGTPKLIPEHGWQSGFILSAAISVLIILALYIWLPADQSPRDNGTKQNFSVFQLLKGDLRNITFAMWTLYIGNSFLLYCLVSWIPTLLTQQGWDLPRAGAMIAYFQFGGLAGSLLVASLMDKWGVYRALKITYIITAFSLASFTVISSQAGWPWAIAIIGAGISSVQLTMNALAANVYPNHYLASGIGFTVAVARLGAVTAPIAGGALIAAQWQLDSFMALLVIPVGLCLTSVYFLQRSTRSIVSD